MNTSHVSTLQIPMISSLLIHKLVICRNYLLIHITQGKRRVVARVSNLSKGQQLCSELLSLILWSYVSDLNLCHFSISQIFILSVGNLCSMDYLSNSNSLIMASFVRVSRSFKGIRPPLLLQRSS